MSQSTYAVYGSPLHLILEDSLAEAWNRAQKAFFDAQVNHKVRYDREWDPVNESLLIKWTDEEQKAYDDIARLINLLIEINGGSLDLFLEQMTSDYLVKL